MFPSLMEPQLADFIQCHVIAQENKGDFSLGRVWRRGALVPRPLSKEVVPSDLPTTHILSYLRR